jgi:hypothetical protein
LLVLQAFLVRGQQGPEELEVVVVWPQIEHHYLVKVQPAVLVASALEGLRVVTVRKTTW